VSKAFTRENDEQDVDYLGADDAELDEGETRGAQTRNYITPQGAQKLKDELHQLLYHERPKVVEAVAWAASNGDRSENADYIYGKRRLREIDRRMRFLQKRLDAAEIVDPAKQSGDRVLFGATVQVRDENDHERIYQIVGVDETDAKIGRISWVSPVGQALLQARKGDVVLLKTPRGEEELEIVDFYFRELNS